MANIIPIVDFSDPRLDVYARLTERELLHNDARPEGMFIAESPKVVTRALDAGYQPLSFLMEPRHVDGEARPLLARCPETPVYTAETAVLTQLTGFQLTRGVLCAMLRKPEPPLEAVCAGARRIAVLEDVMNPTNVGAVVRSAAALGTDALLFTRRCADPLSRRAIRVSMGNVFLLPWTHVEDDWPERLRVLGFKTVAMALRDDSLSLRDPALQNADRLAVVLGTEGDGLADGTITACDHTVRIPMQRGVDSLNVAAASAVAFWELGN